MAWGMKLATFTARSRTRVGVVRPDGIADLSVLAPELPTEMVALLAAAHDAAERATQFVPLSEVTLRSPLLRPGKVLAIGLNYADHIAESGLQRPEVPTVFNKQSTCVIGAGEAIHLPRISQALDYEGELAFVIGRRCRHVPKARARTVIAGYCIMNDVTVRDVQLRSPTWTMGKSFDTHGPMGPWLTTADEVPDPHALRLRTWVEGELRQDSSTAQLVFRCDDLIEHLTQAFTLEPGDVISTGTPGGVGMAMKPPRWLKAGETVRIEIEGLGVLENRVIEEPDTACI
jgi:2-keto-4-pentenoate hydratase/2-oxohepta-3-ene-1,7-dioic acid hydratase in catechol pathway